MQVRVLIYLDVSGRGTRHDKEDIAAEAVEIALKQAEARGFTHSN
jgi:hypothetical protein